jgi:phosphonoacetate hydrolase
MMDGYLGQLDAMGCVIALTADHGMNAKVAMDGTPDVIYLQDWFDAWLGTAQGARDPADHRPVRGAPRRPGLVRHGIPAPRKRRRRGLRTPAEGARHRGGADPCPGGRAVRVAADRIGDLVVVSERFTVIGTSAARHDLSGLEVPLRSHGGISEQRVPLIVNRPLPGLDRQPAFRNFDAFDLALNYAQ